MRDITSAKSRENGRFCQPKAMSPRGNKTRRAEQVPALYKMDYTYIDGYTICEEP